MNPLTAYDVIIPSTIVIAVFICVSFRSDKTGPLGSSLVATVPAPPKTKKADVAEHPEVFDHVGLLVTGPVAAATCPSSSHPTT